MVYLTFYGLSRREQAHELFIISLLFQLVVKKLLTLHPKKICAVPSFNRLKAHSSGRHLIQALQQDDVDFTRNHLVSLDGIGKSSFAEAMSERGLEQVVFVFQKQCKRVRVDGVLLGQRRITAFPRSEEYDNGLKTLNISCFSGLRERR